MNKLLSKCLMLMLALWSLNANASDASKHEDNYFLELNGELLANGSQVYMRYDISLSKDENKANVKITTWHAPISCEGDYEVKKEKKYYTLSFVGKLEDCIYPSPQFYLLKKDGGIFIKGSPLVYSDMEWLKLKKSKKWA
jgi:hypothetical protein